MITLFPDQDVLANALRGASMRVRRVLAVAPTGFGKTILFCYIAMRARERGGRIGIFCHRAELLRQISDSLKLFKVPHGIIGPGVTPDLRHTVFVISAQTYARRVERMPTFTLGVIDEAHHVTANSTWGKCMAHSPEAKWIGVTATPERLDGQGLIHSFDEMVMGPTVRELIDMGRLSDYRLFAPGGMDLSGVKMLGGDYNKGDLADAADKPSVTGDALEHYRKHLNGAPSAAFCVSVAHADHVAEEFKSAGYTAAAIDGKMERNERARIIRDFKAGHLNIISSCEILSEGFDCPGIHGAILLRPTQSLALNLQQVGRALRVSPGKRSAIILDHAGNSGRHGLPCQDRDWTLEGRKRPKLAEENSTFKTCPKCFTRFPMSKAECPDCKIKVDAKERKIDQVAGELEEVAVADIRKLISPERRAQGMAKSIADLVALGHSEGRARHIIEARNEKEGLQRKVIEYMDYIPRASSVEWMPKSEILKLKPKALRAIIQDMECASGL